MEVSDGTATTGDPAGLIRSPVKRGAGCEQLDLSGRGWRHRPASPEHGGSPWEGLEV